MDFAASLTFFTIVGLGLCIVYGAKLNTIQFSLRSIFAIVTTTCVAMAFFASFGIVAFEMLGWLLTALMPPVNFILVAVLCVSVIHTRDEQQAIAIGRLVPLAGLAIADTVRVAAWLTVHEFGWPRIYFFIAVAAYLTALTSGYVAREVFRHLKKKPSSHGAHDYPRGIASSSDGISAGGQRQSTLAGSRST